MTPGMSASVPAVTLCILLLSSSVHAQSVNCAQVKPASARLICSDGELSRLNAQLNTAFKKRTSQLPKDEQQKFVLQEIAWFMARDTRCGLAGKDTAPMEALASAKNCVAEAIQRRISEMSQPLAPSMAGSANHTVAPMLQAVNALRARIRECWKPPEGADSISFVVLRVQFKEDGTLARDPTLVTSSSSAIAPALAESGKRALRACQPFTMLKVENYDQWKDIQIRFDGSLIRAR